MNFAKGRPEVSIESRIAEAVAEYKALLESTHGQADHETLLSKYADVADELKPCLDGLDLLHQVAGTGRDDDARDSGSLDAAFEFTQLEIPDHRLIREIGRGGMGIVYEAEQVSLQRRVAVKILPFATLNTKRQRQRFQNEARSAALLEHSNIVSIYSVGTHNGVDYYSMQLIQGLNFSQILDLIRNDTATNGNDEKTESVDLPEFVKQLLETHCQNQGKYQRLVIEKFIQVANAMQYAHGEGVIHRDIKPSNLLLDDNGKIYVADFGVARVEGGNGMTMTGDVIGTLRYMSPEQASGNQSIVDHRSDIYSLGTTLYELLTLKTPIDAENRVQIIQQLRNATPAPLRKLQPAIPVDLQTVVLKALNNEPNRRYSSARDLTDDLQRFLDGKPVGARPPSLARQAWLSAKRNPKLMIASSIGICLAFVAFILGIQFYKTTIVAQTQQLQINQSEYANDVNAVMTAIESGRGDQGRKILNKYVPTEGDSEDIRGFEWYCLQQMTKSELVAFAGHESSVRSLAISPDGRLVVTGGNDKRIYLWDAVTGKLLHKFEPHPNVAGSVHILKDNKTLICAGDKLRIYDLENYKLLQEYSIPVGDFKGIDRFAIDASETLLVTGTSPNSILEWKISRDGSSVGLEFIKQGPAFEFKEKIWMRGFDVSPDGRFVVWSSHLDSDFLTWDRLTDKVIRRSESDGGHTKVIVAAEFSPDGSMLATGSWDMTIKLWDTKTWQRIRTLERHQEIVRDVAFHPDGKSIFSIGYDGRILRWDVASGEILDVDHDPRRDLSNIAIADSGDFLLTAFSERNSNQLSTIESPGSFKNGGSAMLIKWDTGNLTRLKPYVPASNRSYLEYHYRGSRISSLSLSAKADRFAVGMNDGTVYQENLTTDKKLKSSESPILQSSESDFKFPKKVISLQYSEDGATLLAATHDFTVRLDSSIAEILAKYEHGLSAGTTWQSQGQNLLVARETGGLYFVQKDTGRNIQVLPKINKRNLPKCFSENGDQYVAMHHDGSILIWNLDSKAAHQITDIQGPTDVSSITISEDGSLVASGHVSGAIRIYDVISGRKVQMLQRHLRPISALQFSPDTTRLVSGSHDGSVRIWNPRSGSSLLHLQDHIGQISHVELARDNCKLIVGSSANYSDEIGIVRIWQTAGISNNP